MATVDVNPDPHRANMRQRALLTTDEVVNPQDGTCHIFSRVIQSHYAAQIILKARLTRFYEREDWRDRLRSTPFAEPLRVERRPSGADEAIPEYVPSITPKVRTSSSFEQMALDAMNDARERAQNSVSDITITTGLTESGAVFNHKAHETEAG